MCNEMKYYLITVNVGVKYLSILLHIGDHTIPPVLLDAIYCSISPQSSFSLFCVQLGSLVLILCVEIKHFKEYLKTDGEGRKNFWNRHNMATFQTGSYSSH
jgi:hypothetical protein